jgi:hypothetical protein
MDKQARMEIRRQTGTRELPEPKSKYFGPEYSMSFVCLTCRTSNMRHFDMPPNQYPKNSECPVCKSVTFNLGRHFKAPKKSDTSQWKKIQLLVDHGFLFQKIRLDPNDYESVPYPETLSEAKDFVIKYREWAINSAI